MRNMLDQCDRVATRLDLPTAVAWWPATSVDAVRCCRRWQSAVSWLVSIQEQTVRQVPVSVSVWVCNSWNSLPQHVTEAQSINSSKNRLDKFWRDMGAWNSSCWAHQHQVQVQVRCAIEQTVATSTQLFSDSRTSTDVNHQHTIIIIITRKLCYSKDDRAMRAI